MSLKNQYNFILKNPILLDSIIKDLKDSLEKTYNEILGSKLIEKKIINTSETLKEKSKFKTRTININKK